MGLELYYNCAFRRARLPGLRWSSLRYARLTAPRCLSQEEAFYLNRSVDNRTRRQSNRPSETACMRRPRDSPRRWSETAARVRMPQHATAEEGEPARRLLLAVAAAFPRSKRMAGPRAPGQAHSSSSWWRRSFTSATRLSRKGPGRVEANATGAQASASSFGHHARPAIYHAACLLRG